MLISQSSRIKKPRYAVPATVLAWACALFVVLADNRSFWRSLLAVADLPTPRGIATLFTAFILLSTVCGMLFIGISVKYVGKFLVMMLLILASVIGYFQSEYRVFIDESMIVNVMQTDYKEAVELMNASFITHVGLFGILPSLAVAFVSIEYKPFVRDVTQRAAWVLIALVLSSLAVWFNYKSVAYVGREHKELRMLINPAYALYSGVKYARGRMPGHDAVRPLAVDARQSGAYLDAEHKARKRTIVIFVVGETARAKNFSLNGYERMTNVYLAGDEVINFSNTTSCGTSTAESLPCIFSHFGRSDFSTGKAAQFENVLDVLARAGVSVLWRDNNSGCKGVCARVAAEDLSRFSVPGLCNAEECFDEVLLHRLQEQIDRAGSDALIVLHQKGSHGPAYYKRHPAALSPFSPECRNDAPQHCKNDELLNAYDNSIVYTDYFLHKTITFLAGISNRYNTALIYVSDHGESLGEHGVYLHGMPYFLAPDEQKHIPFIVWLSSGYSGTYRVSRECLTANSGSPYSHDNIFHSLLGLFGVQTAVYKQERDIFSRCAGI